GRVTVFGESAGGMSIGALLGTPAASGLFQQAILESGAASNANDVERATQVAELTIAKAGGRDALATVPWERLVEIQVEGTMERQRGAASLPYMPVVDGVVLPRVPLESIAAGSAAPVRVLIGTTRDEMTLFLFGAPGGSQLDEETAVRRIERQHPGHGREVYE